MKKIFILILVLAAGNSLMAQKGTSRTSTQKEATIAMYSCPMHPEIVSDKKGKCSRCGMDKTRSKKEQMKMDVMKLYTCPMHPTVSSKKQGSCPDCGMQLVEKKAGKKEKTKNKGLMSCCM